jgi:hypothetical protein
MVQPLRALGAHCRVSLGSLGDRWYQTTKCSLAVAIHYGSIKRWLNAALCFWLRSFGNRHRPSVIFMRHSLANRSASAHQLCDLSIKYTRRLNRPIDFQYRRRGNIYRLITTLQPTRSRRNSEQRKCPRFPRRPLSRSVCPAGGEE